MIELTVAQLVERVGILQMAVIVMGALTTFLWLLPGPCQCAKCAVHVNERRMKSLKRAEEIEDQRAKDEEWRHDFQHTGGSFGPNPPDIYDCITKTCPRNKGRGRLDKT